MKNTSAILFVPAKEKMLNKLPIKNVEAYILDLEDSIEECDKEQALDRVYSFLEGYEGKEEIFVRLNSDRLEKEAHCLDEYPNIGFLLPKFENPDIFSENMLDIWKRHRIMALVESPMGLIRVDNIASCSWIDAIAFGAEDYTAAINMKNSLSTLAFAKGMLVTHAKAYGKRVYDTPSLLLDNDIQLEAEIQNSISFGFDGKLAIHPKQIPVIQKLYLDFDIKKMKEIVALYEKEGKAVVTINNQIYEKMHIRRMQKIIKEQEK